jgi:uncharacterized membrane protein YkvI
MIAGQPAAQTSSWFQRFLLPGFAFKAVVIGGGYATGRELAEFFLPSGPWGGLAGMILATAIWSGMCALTFAFALKLQAYDYRSFFKALLGPFWILFEIAYVALVILMLSVFGAAAGAIAAATLGAPPIVGSLALAAIIAGFATFGNNSVERLFKWVSFLLYGVYALFIVLALSGFGDRIVENFSVSRLQGGWVLGGVTYASYNIVGAVVILPVIRHLTSRRDAVVAGLIAGPLAMIPAILFFVAMIAFYPAISAETLPSDFLLQQLNIPVFHYLFQLMIFSALLESGCGAVHAINERVDNALRDRRAVGLTPATRAMLAGTLLICCIFVADRFGLVALIGSGYRILAYVILAIYVIPLIMIGLPQLIRRRGHRGSHNGEA